MLPGIIDGHTADMDAADDREPEIARFANGRVKYSGFRIGDDMHGAWSWYRTDGSLVRTGQFDRGRQAGAWRTYDRSGSVVKGTTFPDA